MHTSNDTIYHTGDMVALYNHARAISHARRGYYSGRGERIKLLTITYSHYRGADVTYDYEKLTIRVPRRNKLQASALTALAGASIDAPEGDALDENYCFLAPPSLCVTIRDSIISRLYRGRNNISESPPGRLRYCNRLKKGQKQWQTLGKQRRQLETLHAEKAAVEATILEVEKGIKLGEAFEAKFKSKLKNP